MSVSRPPGVFTRPLVLAAVAATVVLAITTAGGLLVFSREQPLPQVTPAPTLLGEAVPMGLASHVDSAAELELTPGAPPSGGPHFASPLGAGISTTPVADGNAIHSLEHGMVWITYRADLIGERDLETLTAVARAHRGDVILSPRPENAAPAAVVSWGRRLILPTPVARETLEAFVVTNVDQAPEPGLR